MRKPIVTLLLAAVLSPTTAHADGMSLTDAAPSRLSDRGATMKRHGKTASILGIIQLTVGMAAGIASIIPCHSDVADGCGGNMVAFASGATFTVLGAISATAGIPMWIYGAREEREAKLRLSATASGLKLTF